MMLKKNFLLLSLGLVLSSALTVGAQVPTPQPKAEKPVLKPAGNTPAKPAANDRVRKRSGQIAGPTNNTEKQPRWTVAKPDLPGEATLPENAARELYERARSLLIQRKPEDALPLLKQAEGLEAGRYEIQFLLGIAHGMLQRAEDAASAFQKAVKLKPDSAQSHSALCIALSETDRWIEAVDSCREAVRLDPTKAAYRAQLAQLYVRDDRAVDAIQLLESVDRQARNDVVFNGTLGDAYYSVGEYARAAQLYERIAATWPVVSITYLRLSGAYDHLNRPNDMVKAARKFVELEPRLVIAHLNLGLALKTSGFFEESIEPLQRAIALDASSGDAYLELSETYEVLGDRENVFANLRRAYRLLPRNPDLAFRVGTLLAEYGHKTEAVEPLEWANANRPGDPDIMRSLGFAYLDVREYDKGIELIDRAQQILPLPPGLSIEISGVRNRRELLARFDELLARVQRNPSDVKSRRGLAEAYEYKGMPKEKEQQYFEIIKLQPTWENYNFLSIFYSRQGEFEKALDAIRKAVELNPHHVLYMSMSSALKKRGRLDEAIQAAKRSVEIKPILLESRIWLGELWLKKGNREEALREFQEAYAIAPGDVRPNFRLAWLYIRMGNRDGAFRHYAVLKSIASNYVGDLELSLKAHFGSLP